MILTFRPIKVRPADWKRPGAQRIRPTWAASYTRTLEDLDRELAHLGGTDPFLQLDLEPKDLRLDGQIRAGAVPAHPGVILTFDTKAHGALTYSTDRFEHWHWNLRAISLTLDALRRIERYGAASAGQQYAGYREIGSGTPLGPTVETMTVDEAARLLAVEAFDELDAWVDVLHDPDVAYRLAAKKHHPDAGGNPEIFRRLTLARNLLANR